MDIGVQRVLHMALIGSTVVYGVLGFALKGTGSGSIPYEATWALLMAGVVAALAGVFIYRRPETVVNRAAPTEAGKPPITVVAWMALDAAGVCGLIMMLADGPGIYLIAGALVLLLLHPPRRDVSSRA